MQSPPSPAAVGVLQHAPAASMTSSRGTSIVLPLQAFCRCRCGGDRCRKAVSGHCKKRSKKSASPPAWRCRCTCASPPCKCAALISSAVALESMATARSSSSRSGHLAGHCVYYDCLPSAVKKGRGHATRHVRAQIHMATAARSDVHLCPTCVAGAAAAAWQTCARACSSTVLSGTHCHRKPACHVPPQHKACACHVQRRVNCRKPSHCFSFGTRLPPGAVSQVNGHLDLNTNGKWWLHSARGYVNAGPPPTGPESGGMPGAAWTLP